MIRKIDEVRRGHCLSRLGEWANWIRIEAESDCEYAERVADRLALIEAMENLMRTVPTIDEAEDMITSFKNAHPNRQDRAFASEVLDEIEKYIIAYQVNFDRAHVRW